MKKVFLSACAFLSMMLFPAFAQIGDPHIFGPAVSGKFEGSAETAYVPYSKGSGDKAVIATESFAMQRLGLAMSKDFVLSDVGAGKKPCVGGNWRRIKLDMF